MPQLDALSAERLVIAPYLPGYGGSSGPFSIARACDELLHMLDERGLDIVEIGGLSLGAIVALQFALQQPDRIRRLTLCAGFLRLPAALKSRQEELVSSLRAMPDDSADDIIEGLFSGVPEQYRSAAVRELAGMSPADFTQIFAEVNDYDATAVASMTSIDAHVCCGELDELNLPLGKELADRLNMDLRVITQAGHVANLDASDAFTDLLRP